MESSIEQEETVTPQILKDLLAKQEYAFDIVYSAYYKDIYYLIYMIVKDPEETRELAQDVFVKMWLKLKPITTPSVFKAWFFRLTKNYTIDFIRRRSEKLQYFEEESYSDYRNENTVHDMKKDFKMILKEREYQVIVLNIILNMPKTVIAEFLSCPEGTVASLYSRGMEKLRKYYGDSVYDHYRKN